MQFNYRGSFFRLLLAGFMLAVLPLLAGLINDHLAIRHLSKQSQQAVHDAARIAHSSRELNDTAVSLERAAQQNAVLQDDALAEAVTMLSRRFKAAAQRLAELPLSVSSRQQLAQLAQQEVDLERTWPQAFADPQAAAALVSQYAQVSWRSGRLLEYSSSLIEQEADNLRQLAASTENHIGVQLLLLLPLAICIVAIFAWLLARPIKQLSDAIRELGERRLHTPVVVKGPADLERLGKELDWLRQRLLHLEEQKSQFLRHVSHELKTPLTAMREGSELLAEEVVAPLHPRQREIVRILQQSSLDLQQLIETLLRHAEAEFRLGQVELQPHQPAELIHQVLQRHQLACRARALQIHLAVDDFSLLVDASRFKVIIDNLLSNAIRFSPRGGQVRIAARLDPAGQDAIISVSDQGPGVAPGEEGDIFKPFHRSFTQLAEHADEAVTVAGSGLGLSISRDHAQAMGGCLSVHPGSGEFILRLPLNAKSETCSQSQSNV